MSIQAERAMFLSRLGLFLLFLPTLIVLSFVQFFSFLISLFPRVVLFASSSVSHSPSFTEPALSSPPFAIIVDEQKVIPLTVRPDHNLLDRCQGSVPRIYLIY